MEYTRLGTTGLRISRLALGCMSYGDASTPGAHPWALPEDQAEPFFRQAPHDEPVINAVQQVARARSVSMAQVALAWVLRHPAVSAPIVGATKSHHLTQAVEALQVQLTDDEVAELEASYVNAGPSWY